MEDKIYFSERQVIRRVRQIDRTTGRTSYVPIYHSKLTNKDGSPKRYCRIIVPDKNHRDFSFSRDENGIERNDCRCFIQVPYDCIYNIQRDGKKTLQSFLVISNPSEYTRFTVYFQGTRDPRTGQFSKPQSCKINLDQLKQCFVRREKDLMPVQQINQDREKDKQIQKKKPTEIVR